jgi:hypothetical protein
VNTRHLEVFAEVLNLVDLARIAENPPLAVTQDGALFPAALPEFVANLEVFFGVVIARVVLGLGWPMFLAPLSRYEVTMFQPARPLVR